eukprot:TRINITY_DN18497_c0_g1_i2.p1 TRINITY_DN18497_c0_g1~~TRINITY_DN18497_c0_g1_i2.p1  ORF type:complete len:241 (-),score=60.76 TRINITY_DN18497_c0_g1_i2:75-776(-)
MAKLAEALREAAAASSLDDAAFGAACSTVLTKIKRGSSEVKKAPELLEKEVPANEGAWAFLLRVTSERPAYARQAWEASALLLESGEWQGAFRSLEAERKRGLNVGRAGARDLALVRGLVRQLLAAGAAEIGELIPAEACADLDPAFCAEIVQLWQDAEHLPAGAAEAARTSDTAKALLERAAAGTGGSGGAEKRRVIGGSGQQTYGSNEDIPVYVCEGIHGSHQKMDIKKGL